MKKFQSVMIFITIVGAGLIFSACDSENDALYDLDVHWNIGGLNVCKAFLPEGEYAQDELVFTTVEINIYEDETETEAVRPPDSLINCGAFERTIPDLPRGSYYVTIDAFAEYDGEELPFFKGEAEVSVPAEGDSVDIPLIVGDGKIVVTWQFASGMTCGVNEAGEAEKIIVTLENTDNAEINMEFEASCGDGRIVIDDVFPDDTYRVTALAIDSNGDALYQAFPDENPFEVLPGQSYPAVVVFQ